MLFAPQAPQSMSSTPTATSCPRPRPHSCAKLCKRESPEPLSPAHRPLLISLMRRDRPGSRFHSRASQPSRLDQLPAKPCATSAGNLLLKQLNPTFPASSKQLLSRSPLADSLAPHELHVLSFDRHSG